MARLIEWTPDRIKKATDLIFKRIVGGESVRKILSTDEQDDLPSRKTFYEWMAVSKELSDQYAKVMIIRSDDLADEILEIADNFEHDVVEADGRDVIDHAVVNRDRLRVDARKWILSKMHPKKYGEKIDMTSGNEPLKQSLNILVDNSQTAETLKRLREEYGSSTD